MEERAWLVAADANENGREHRQRARARACSPVGSSGSAGSGKAGRWLFVRRAISIDRRVVD